MQTHERQNNVGTTLDGGAQDMYGRGLLLSHFIAPLLDVGIKGQLLFPEQEKQ